MGVFARLIRRSKATEETAAQDASTDGAPGAVTEDGTAGAGAVAPAPERTGAGAEAGAAEAGPDGVAGAGEGIGIPKQQSVGQATDSGADEDARR
ncbi:hypothetical protein GA0115242_126898 [Streptomyces sp. SolWspMP-5a-2]|nr:hypothetical protein GA0115242_126898 [Streptomyces sp. SolWspMP-5a-2]